MNFEIVKDIDEQLFELAEKKKKLDKRIEQRESNLVDFNAAHYKSMERLHQTIQAQNAAARERNLNFFQEVNYATGYVQDQRNRYLGKSNARTASKNSRQLEQARENYLKFSEKLMPSYRDHQAMQQIGALHKMKLEKEQAEARRQSSLREMERAHQLQCAVEQERRQLVLALALEERDKLAAAAERRILQSQGRAVDQVIQQEFDTFGDEYANQVNDASSKGFRQVQPTVQNHFASNRLLSSDSLPLPIPRNIANSAAENLTRITEINNLDTRDKPKCKNDDQGPFDEYSNRMQQSKHPQSPTRVVDSQHLRPGQDKDDVSIINAREMIPSFQAATYESHSNESKSTPRKVLDNPSDKLRSSDLTNSTQSFIPASPLFSPPCGKMTNNNASSGSKNPTIESVKENDYEDENIFNISKENMRLPSAELPPKPPMKHPSSISSSDIDSEVLDSSTGNDETLDLPISVPSDVSNISTSLIQQQVSSPDIKDHDDDKIKKSDELPVRDSANSISTEPNKVDLTPVKVIEASQGTAEQNQSEQSVSDIDVSNPTVSNTDDLNKDETENSLFVPTPSMTLKSTSSPRKTPSTSKPVVDQLETSTDSIKSLLMSPQSPGVDIQITKGLQSTDVITLFQKVCAYIETFTQPLAVRKGYGIATTPAASKALSGSTGVGLDRQKRLLHALLANREYEVSTFQVEVACALLLRVTSEKGDYILPSDVLNGVVSADKIAKSHKKMGGGRGDMWNAIVAHMTNMTTLKRMPQEEFAKIFTNSFVSHIDENERSRYERKILKTLQLAIMPKEVSSSPAGTPLKSNSHSPQVHTLSADLSRTPPISPSASLGDSSDKIGNIFTGANQKFVNENKFRSQRAVENGKNKSTSSKSSTGIAISSSGKSMLNKIQKISQFDDDEIEDDEVIASPPKLHDLSEDIPASSVSKRDSKPDLNTSDEFDF